MLQLSLSLPIATYFSPRLWTVGHDFQTSNDPDSVVWPGTKLGCCQRRCRCLGMSNECILQQTCCPGMGGSGKKGGWLSLLGGCGTIKGRVLQINEIFASAQWSQLDKKVLLKCIA